MLLLATSVLSIGLIWLGLDTVANTGGSGADESSDDPANTEDTATPTQGQTDLLSEAAQQAEETASSGSPFLLSLSDAEARDMVAAELPRDALPETPNIYEGGAAADEITAGAGTDFLLGGDNDDELQAGAGRDFANGQFGNDVVRGGAGDDLVRGGAGNDTVFGGDGDDVVFGCPGDDTLYGGAGDDVLRGAQGTDELNGGAGDDLLITGQGADVLNGGTGDDELIGTDVIKGYISFSDMQKIADNPDQSIAETLRRPIELVNEISGPDILNGGAGDDRIWLGRNDVATGGAGADDFFAAMGANTWGFGEILDFDPDEDVLSVGYLKADGPPDVEIDAYGDDFFTVMADGVAVVDVHTTKIIDASEVQFVQLD